MLVVADSSPVNILVRIGEIEIVPRLFGQLLIPTVVAQELRNPNSPPAVRAFIESPPSWLEIREPYRLERFPHVDAGEEAAIALAREVHAQLLLIDEKVGRRAARTRVCR